MITCFMTRHGRMKKQAWMECENGIWYIETSDTEWEEYTGDTSNLWHIQNLFDE